MADRLIQRNDTAVRWQSINPILATGEIGIEIDGAKGYKIGDGKTRWNDLPYPANPTNVVQELGNNENAVPSQKLVTEKLSELGSKVDKKIAETSQYDSALLELDINPNAGWEFGSYDVNSGAIISSATTIHTRVLYTGEKECKINLGDSYRYALHQFNEKGEFIAVLNTFNMSSSVITIAANVYYRLFLRKMDQTEIADMSFVNNITIGYPNVEFIDLRDKTIIAVDAIATSLSYSLLSKVGQRFYNTSTKEIRELVTFESTKVINFNQHDTSLLLCNNILYSFDADKNPIPMRNIIEIVDITIATSLTKALVGELYYNIAEKALRKITASNDNGKTSTVVPLFEHIVYKCGDSFYIYNGAELKAVNKDATITKPIQPLIHYAGAFSDLVQGSFGIDGNFYPTNTYTCHSEMLRYSDTAKIKINEIGITSFVVYFEDNGQWIPSISKVSFIAQSEIMVLKDKNAMVFFRYADNRTMSAELMSSLKSKIEVSIYPKLVADVKTMSYWVAPKIPSIVDMIDNISYNDMIGKYQQLIAKHSDYLSMGDVILDSSGNYMIKEIVATPSAYDKTIMIVTGIHGNEYESIWSMYYFLKLLCENYLEWEEIAYIRNNVRLVLIPIASPYSFANNQRYNVNGLDPNWNYDVFWGVEGREWNGETPFSEKEALAVKMVFDKYEHEIDFVYDWHTDPYDGLGNYITIEHAVPDYDESIKRIREEKDRLNYLSHGSRNAFINNNQRSSSYNYFAVKRGVPSAIVEFSNNQISPIQGDEQEMTWAVQWFVNVLLEQIKRLPYKIDYQMSDYIKSEDKELYSLAVSNNVEAKGLIYESSYKDEVIHSDSNEFTLIVKGIITQECEIARIVGETKIKAIPAENDSYNILIGNSYVFSNPLFKYGKEVVLTFVAKDNSLSLYADCHLIRKYDNITLTISNFERLIDVRMLLYKKALSKKDIYLTYCGIAPISRKV